MIVLVSIVRLPRSLGLLSPDGGLAAIVLDREGAAEIIKTRVDKLASISRFMVFFLLNSLLDFVTEAVSVLSSVIAF